MNDETLPDLNADEQRVLGSLIEKSRATPEYYPMTLNALTAACSQKTSRNPVVLYTEETVITTLDSLKRKGLVSTATGGSSRVTKYKHNLAIQYPLVPAELSVLCLLLLRGPLTAGEINSTSGRLYEFDSLTEVQEVLQRLAENTPPFIRQMEKRTGQKEIRYMHLLGAQSSQEDSAGQINNLHANDLEQRVALLEQQLAELREEFAKLLS